MNRSWWCYFGLHKWQYEIKDAACGVGLETCTRDGCDKARFLFWL